MFGWKPFRRQYGRKMASGGKRGIARGFVWFHILCLCWNVEKLFHSSSQQQHLNIADFFLSSFDENKWSRTYHLQTNIFRILITFSSDFLASPRKKIKFRCGEENCLRGLKYFLSLFLLFLLWESERKRAEFGSLSW